MKDLSDRSQTLQGIFDYDLKAERLEEVLRELEPTIWNDQSRTPSDCEKERAVWKYFRVYLIVLTEQLDDAKAMLDLAVETDDENFTRRCSG